MTHLSKACQGAEPSLVWAMSGDRSSKGKAFLVVNGSQSGFGCRIAHEKPDGLKSDGALAALVRKYLPTARFLGAWQARGESESKAATGSIWILLGGPENQTWYLQLAQGSPPEISLVAPAAAVEPPKHARKSASRTAGNGATGGASSWISLARLSSRGMFTKRQPIEQSPPSFDALADERHWLPIVSETPADAPTVSRSSSESESHPPGAVAQPWQRVARDRIARRLKTLKKSLEREQGRVSDSAAADAAEREARLAQSFAWLIQPESIVLELDATQTGDGMSASIALDPELTPGANINSLFVRARRLARTRESSGMQVEKLRQAVTTMTADLEQLRAKEMSEAEVEVILVRHDLASVSSAAPGSRAGGPTTPAGPPTTQKSAQATPYKTFLSPSTANQRGEPRVIFVGKGSTENDELTKAARSNDFWLHVSGMPGSHVIVPTLGPAEKELPAALAREAGMLAVHHSKLRASRSGEVHLTRKQFLRKKKGMAPGAWLVERSRTFQVRYESEDIDRIMSFRGHETASAPEVRTRVAVRDGREGHAGREARGNKDASSDSAAILRHELHVHLYGCIDAKDLWELGRDRWQKNTTRLDWFASEYQRATGQTIDWREFWAGDSGFDKLRAAFEFRSPAPFPVFQAHFNLLIALLPVVPDDAEILQKAMHQSAAEGLRHVEYRAFLPPMFDSEQIRTLISTLTTAAHSFEVESGGSFSPRVALSVSRDAKILAGQYAAIRAWQRTNAGRTQLHILSGLDFCGMEEGFAPKDKLAFFAEVTRDNRNAPTPLALLYHVGESFDGMTPASAARWVATAALGGCHRLGHAIALGIPRAALSRHAGVECAGERRAHLDWLVHNRDLLGEFGYEFDDAVVRAERTALDDVPANTVISVDEERPGIGDLEQFQDALMMIVRERTAAVIEVCPTSNERIARLESPKHHPLHRFRKAGLRIVIGADDPGILATSLAAEGRRLTSAYGFTTADLETFEACAATSTSAIMTEP